MVFHCSFKNARAGQRTEWNAGPRRLLHEVGLESSPEKKHQPYFCGLESVMIGSRELLGFFERVGLTEARSLTCGVFARVSLVLDSVFCVSWKFKVALQLFWFCSVLVEKPGTDLLFSALWSIILRISFKENFFFCPVLRPILSCSSQVRKDLSLLAYILFTIVIHMSNQGLDSPSGYSLASFFLSCSRKSLAP